MSFEILEEYENPTATLIDEDDDSLDIEVNYEEEKVSFRVEPNGGAEVFVSFADVDKMLDFLSEALDV